MPTKLPKQKPSEDETPAHPSNPLLIALGLLILLLSSLFSPVVFVNSAGKIYYGVAAMLSWAMMASLVKGLGFVPDNKILKAVFSEQAVVAALIAAGVLRFM